jgi:hypothetical protein
MVCFTRTDTRMKKIRNQEGVDTAPPLQFQATLKRGAGLTRNGLASGPKKDPNGMCPGASHAR